MRHGAGRMKGVNLPGEISATLRRPKELVEYFCSGNGPVLRNGILSLSRI